MKQHHKKYFLGAGIGFLIFKIITLVIGGIGLIGDNFSKAEWIGPNRNNDVFVDQTFRDASPNQEQIKQAFLGIDINDKTAYTNHWTNNLCDYTGLVVQNVYPGTDTIPASLVENTLYILNPGNYITTYTDGILMENCSAIIGNGNVNVFSNIQLTDNVSVGEFIFSGKENSIIDKINIDGTNDGAGGNHIANRNGIVLKYSNNNTINNSQIYNNKNVGIYMTYSSNNTMNNINVYDNDDGNSLGRGMRIISSSNRNMINNSDFYGNGNGIDIWNSLDSNNEINNSQIYNNGNYGIRIADSSFANMNNLIVYNNHIGIALLYGSGNNSINNSQIYNNDSPGIYIYKSINNNINNSQLYNNLLYGIRLSQCSGTIINNSNIYNNLPSSIQNDTATNTKYYGNLKIDTNLPGGLSAGTGIYFSTLGWNTGSINTGVSIDCSWITNPVTTGLTYLHTSNLCNSTGNISAWTGNISDNYRYGTNILTQIQPVLRSGSNIILYGTEGLDYDTNKHIGLHQYFGGTFDINNNTGTTNQTGVVLYNNLNNTDKMNFSNDGSSWNGRENYATTKNWNLSLSTGLKNIYADFSGNNGEIFMGLDTIIYDTNFDYEPDQFTFVDKTGAELNTIYTSNIITITGMSPGVFTGISVDYGNLFKNGVNIGTNGTGGNGDQFYIQLSSSSSYSTSVGSTMTIGGIIDTFSIVTENADYEPNQVRITDILDAELNTIYNSNTVTILGMSPGLFTGISVDYGNLFKNGVNIGTNGTGGNGDQFYIQLSSSNLYSTTITSNLLMGSMHQSFDVITKTADYTPNQFSFLNKTGADLNILYTSNIITITGMSPVLFTGMSVNNGYIIKNGLNIGQSGTGENGDQIVLALTSSNNYSTIVSSILDVGGVTGSFEITTREADYIPDQFNFNNENDAELNTEYTSNTIDIQGMDNGLRTGISINNGILFKNGINIGTGGTGGNDDQFYIKLTSSNLYSTNISSNLEIGGVTGSFEITTREADYIPIPFGFAIITGAEINTVYTSNIVTISGMDNGLRTGISINNGILFKNGINIGTGGTGGNGDQFYIQLTSSSSYSSGVSSIVHFSNIDTGLSIFTKDDDGFPVISGANNGAYYSGDVNIEIIDDNFDGVFINSNWSTQSGFTLTGILGGITSYYLTAVDLAGNASYISFVIDNAAPTTTDNVNTNTSSGDQNIALFATDNGTGVYQTYYCVDNLGGTCSPNINGTSVSVTGASNIVTQKIVRYFSRDLIGNTENIKISSTITIDKQSPINIGFDLNSGATYTTGVNIWITNITGTDSRGPIQIAYGTSVNVSNRTSWSEYKLFILDNVDGEKIIYVRFKDAGGNISITSGSIILDSNAPIITINNPNTSLSTGKIISASTDEGVLTMTTGSTNTTCDTSRNFITYESLTFTGESDNGKYVCYRAVDSGGNISYSLSNAIAGIDTTLPTMNVISPSSIVGETGIFLSITSNENSSCKYNTSAGVNFDSMIGLSGTGLSHTGDYVASEGSNTLYFKCRDTAGNISNEISYTFSVNLGDPLIQFVYGTMPNSATNNSGVNIYLTGAEITKYKFELITGSSCDGVIYDGGEIDINTTITQGPTISDEEYSYCAIGFKTGLNVWQVTGTRYTFVYDNTPPVITVNDGINTNWNTGDNINLSVNYNLAGTSGTKYIWTNNLNCGVLDYSSGNNYISGTNIIVNSQIYNNIFMCYRSIDLAGNIDYGGIGGPFKIDLVAPISNINNTGSNRITSNISFSITGNDMIIPGSLTCLDSMVQIACALNQQDDGCPVQCRNTIGGVGLSNIYYKILTGDVSCSAGNYSSYNTSVNINIDTGSTAIKTVCYYGVDNLGNAEGYNKQLYKIDKQGPSINLLSPGSGSTSTSGTSVNFAWSGTDLGIGISGYIFRIYSGADLITGINLIGTNIVLQGLVNGNYLWNVESIDILGNTGISNTQSFVNINQYVVLPDTSNIDDFISEFTGKGYIQTTGTDIFDELNTGTLAGNTEIYFGIDNEIQNDVVMQSTGSNNKIGILINSGTFIIETGANANSCEDLIYSPVFVDNSLARDLMEDQNIFETFRVGSMCENVSLNFVNASGSSVDVKIKVKSDNLDNDEYKVRYSNNGVDRNYLGDYDYNNGLEIDIDHMTYFAISQDKQVASNGGSRKLEKDNCEYSSRNKNNLPGANEEGVDYSDSYYDRDCRGNEHGITLEGDISGSQFSDELNYAYLYAYQIGSTTMPHINQANMMGNLIRKHLAKMISNYAINEMGMSPDENRNCNFNDIDNESAEMGYYINLACQLGLMGLKSDGSPDTKFNPNDTVTRSQFGTALSRLLYGDEFNVGKNEVWYSKHLNNLKSKNIMNKIDNPGSHEKRGYVMLMLMRSKKLK